MKFGKQFDRHKVRGWDGVYVDYTGLKESLKQLSFSAKGCADVSGERDAWFVEVEESVNRVNDFFHAKADEVESRLDAAMCELREARGTGIEAQLKVHLQSVARKLHTTLVDLSHFSSANYTALYKIFKKYDKQMGASILQLSLQHVAQQPFHDGGKKRLEELQQRVSVLADESGLNSDLLLAGRGSASKRESLWAVARLCFSLGVISMALLVLAVLSQLEPQTESYSETALSATIPVFRLFFMLNLAVWLAGGCALVFERYKVNYLFLLDISPDLDVTAMSLLNFASLQTLIWIVLFFCFLADFKFGALLLTSRPTPAASSFYTRSLITSQLSVTAFWMSSHYRGCWWGIWLQVGLAPVVPVTFASNLFADFLASCGRPLKDLAYTACYLSHWRGEDLFDGDVLICKATHGSLEWKCLQVMLIVPLLIRIAQCLRRVHDTKIRHPHLLNCGKYATAVLVSALAAAPLTSWGLSEAEAHRLRIAGYVTATCYAAAWDLVVDFGLFVPQRQCLYPKATYSAVAAMNIMLRSTWMLTYLDDCRDFVSASSLNCESFSFAIGTLELCRRALWAIVRLEHEHLTNAARFRSVCWVPPLEHRRASASTARPGCSLLQRSMTPPSVCAGGRLLEHQKSLRIVPVVSSPMGEAETSKSPLCHSDWGRQDTEESVCGDLPFGDGVHAGDLEKGAGLCGKEDRMRRAARRRSTYSEPVPEESADDEGEGADEDALPSRSLSKAMADATRGAASDKKARKEMLARVHVKMQAYSGLHLSVGRSTRRRKSL